MFLVIRNYHLLLKLITLEILSLKNMKNKILSSLNNCTTYINIFRGPFPLQPRTLIRDTTHKS